MNFVEFTEVWNYIKKQLRILFSFKQQIVCVIVNLSPISRWSGFANDSASYMFRWFFVSAI